MSKKASSAVNQQETHCFEWGSSETIRQAPLSKFSPEEIKSYLFGSMHDATLSSKEHVRFSQKGTGWLEVIQKLLLSLDHNSWIYKEGKNRDVYVVETTADFLDFNFDPYKLGSDTEKRLYVRGFFDAEGGIPQSKEARFYIQLAQKDKKKIQKLKEILADLGIKAGKIHNPSKEKPNYWRISILADSQERFVRKISSWHPRKLKLLKERKMI